MLLAMSATVHQLDCTAGTQALAILVRSTGRDICNNDGAHLLRVRSGNYSRMGQLTTHVLDTSAGHPAQGVRIELAALEGTAARPIAQVLTGPDGRCTEPLLAGEALRAGRYALTFHTAAYFRARGVRLPEPAFLERALIEIGIADPAQHYHVPLLITPWSYSVYRGG